jgi:predicted ATPase
MHVLALPEGLRYGQYWVAVAAEQQTFGALVRRYRLRAGLTQEGLAERAGLSLRGVSDLERGLRRAPYPDTVERLVSALELDLAEREALHAARHATHAASVEKAEALMPVSVAPVPLTSFVGRERELLEIHQLLGKARLLTLVGAGGVGKTRLVLQASLQESQHFEHGVQFVALAGVGSGSMLPSAVATVLGISFYGSEDPHLQLVRYLRDRKLLLVLDNFEHLMDEAWFVTEVVRGAPGVRILVTSRERLNLEEEWVLTLDGLACPDRHVQVSVDDYPAPRLFVERALQTQAHFSIAEHALTVADICTRVDGLPLAIELAAGWLRVMPCEQIALQIQRSLDFLTTSVRNVPERHRSQRAVFDTSWGLLSDTEQRALMSLSVFRGGFDAGAAYEVAGASLAVLAAVIDKSLVRPVASARYELHDLLRQYLSWKLVEHGAVTEVERRHFAYYLGLADEAESKLYGPDQEMWYDRLQQEHNNLAAALSWSIRQNELESGLRLASALRFFWENRGYFQNAHEWFEKLLARSGDIPGSVRAKALRTAGVFQAFQGDMLTATSLCEESLRLARESGDRWNEAWCLADLGFFEHWVNVPRGVGKLEEALRLFRALEDGWGTSHLLRRLGWFLTILGEYGYATELLQEAVTLARRAGNQHALAWALLLLGNVAWLQRKDAMSARPMFEESLAYVSQTHDVHNFQYAMLGLGQLAHARGDYDEARSRYEQVVAYFRERGVDVRAADLSTVVLAFAQLAVATGNPGLAARLFGSAHAALSKPYLDFADRESIDRDMSFARRQLGESAFSAEFESGRDTSIEDALTYAVQGRAREYMGPNRNRVGQPRRSRAAGGTSAETFRRLPNRLMAESTRRQPHVYLLGCRA